MWTRLALFLLVGLAYASNTPAWKDQSEYVYSVRGRTLTGLHDIADQYSGIFLKAKLALQLRADGKMQGRIQNAQYAQIQTHLPNGWKSEVADSELSYKSLGLSSKPFQLVLKNGYIKSLIVDENIPNWEANIIKSIVSQFQMDLNGKYATESEWSTFPSRDSFEGVFKTKEQTVTGDAVTVYEIHQLPEYIIESQPWLVPQEKLRGDGQVIEINKYKNYTSHSENRPGYHYGFGHVEGFGPSSNKMGEFFARESDSRIIVTGEFARFTIQSASTVNRIMVNPTSKSKQVGTVVSMMNVTLEEVKNQQQEPEELSNPMEIGDLVYTFEDPFKSNNKVHKKHLQKLIMEDSSEQYERRPRSIDMSIMKLDENHESDEFFQQQPMEGLSRASPSPLLPYLTGNQGRSIKKSNEFRLNEEVKKLAKEISEEVQQPELIWKQATLSKYIILNKLVRLMDEADIKSVAQQLYPKDQQDKSRRVWNVYRDSVAECGSGPAFLNIREWIQTQKIEKDEAAVVVATMANAVRVPTFEYMKKFFELVKSDEVKRQNQLNETAILTWTDLAYKVYVNRNESHNQYPVHAFGNFNTKEGREYVKDVVVPYLAEQLERAIADADSEKIHVYIVALGNLGHEDILNVFEPYLEGKKTVSQFQRMWMVLALDRFASQQPNVAQSIFYRIYQNIAELPEIRVVAVHKLLQCQPSTEMLQHMAQLTNTDIQEQVNAAVKSALVSASRLESDKHQQLRRAAESAVPFLTRKQYGSDQSVYGLKDYIVRELGVSFSKRYMGVGSQDSDLPRILGLELDEDDNGMGRRYMKLQGAISSFRDLINVLEQQTEKNHQNKQQRSQEQSRDSNMASSKIAKLLQYQGDEREQLEAVILAEIEHCQKMWTINNQTLEQLPEIVRRFEESLKNGKEFSYLKLKQFNERALAFPTEMGFPFLYTYDMPIMVRVEGHIKAAAQPKISYNQQLRKPEEIRGEIDASITLGGEIQSHLSFVTPFDGQVYVAGVERQLQAHVPLRAKFMYKQGQLQVELVMHEKHQDSYMVHYQNLPYVSTSDVFDVKPVSKQSSTKIIKSDPNQQRSFDVSFGQKETGLSCRAYGQYPIQTFSLADLPKALDIETITAVWEKIWDKSAMRYTELHVGLEPKKTNIKKIVFTLNHEEQYRKKPELETVKAALRFEEYNDKIQQEQRQKELLKYIGSGIQSARLSGADITMELHGEQTFKHIFGYGLAKSNADPASRGLIYYKNQQQDKLFVFEASEVVPNTNGLDMTTSLNIKPKADYTTTTQYGKCNEQPTKINVKLDLNRSEARKQALLRDPMYYVCKQQMQQGNSQLSACQNMTIRANFLDNIRFKVQTENVPEKLKEHVQFVYGAVLTYYYPMVELMESELSAQDGVFGEIQFDPETLWQANVTLEHGNRKTRFYNMSLRNEMIRNIVVPHPVFHLPSRIAGVIKGQQHYRPTCVVDQTATQTFSNKTYQSELPEQYTVVMQYIPNDSRKNGQEQRSVDKQLTEQLENYIVLARQSSFNKKELMIVFNHPKTQGRSVQIEMKPLSLSSYSGSRPSVTVTVDGQTVNFDDKQIADMYNGFVQIYALPNGEVKFEIDNVFYLIFDGKRVKLTATSGKLRNSVMGLCGRFSDDKYEDFTTPAQCIVRSAEKFVETYKINDQRRQQRSGEYSHCVKKVLPLYGDVIRNKNPQPTGTQLRPRYVEENGEICFTIHPLPTCNDQATSTVTKQVPVHCITGTKTAYYLKKQIEQGGNPDFGHKSETKTLSMEVPTQCA